MSRDYLSDKEILVVSIPLAKVLGVAASVVLRRVQNWLEYNEAHKSEKLKTHFRDNRWWTYNGYQGWTDDIKIYSRSTIRRLLNTLEELGLLLTTDKYNKRENDQTKWYSIDYETYDAFMELWLKHQCPLFRDGKQSSNYQKFLDAWNDLRFPIYCYPMPAVDTPPVYSEQGSGSTPVHSGQPPLSTVSIALPESPESPSLQTESKEKESVPAGQDVPDLDLEVDPDAMPIPIPEEKDSEMDENLTRRPKPQERIEIVDTPNERAIFIRERWPGFKKLKSGKVKGIHSHAIVKVLDGRDKDVDYPIEDPVGIVELWAFEKWMQEHHTFAFSKLSTQEGVAKYITEFRAHPYQRQQWMELGEIILSCAPAPVKEPVGVPAEPLDTSWLSDLITESGLLKKWNPELRSAVTGEVLP